MNIDEHRLTMSANRLESLGDGIFSVAMTILVIELKIPTVQGNSFKDLLHGLYEIRQELFCYFISFIVLGIMWFGHRMVFEYISRTNRYFIFLGVLFYMVVCLVPFSTRFLAANTLKWYAILMYGLNLSLCNLTLICTVDIWNKTANITCTDITCRSKKRSTIIVFNFTGIVCNCYCNFFFFANGEYRYLFYYSHSLFTATKIR